MIFKDTAASFQRIKSAAVLKPNNPLNEITFNELLMMTLHLVIFKDTAASCIIQKINRAAVLKPKNKEFTLMSFILSILSSPTVRVSLPFPLTRKNPSW